MEYVLFSNGLEVYHTKNLSEAVNKRDAANEVFYHNLVESVETGCPLEDSFTYLLSVYLDKEGKKRCFVLE